MSFDLEEWAIGQHARLGSGAETVTRTATRRVNLPDDLRLRLPLRWAMGTQREFRVTSLQEGLSLRSGDGPKYNVRAFGPVVTPTGKDHKTNTGQQDWRGWPPVATVQDGLSFPEELLPFLWGPQILLAAQPGPDTLR
jgi:hypothetical protein